MWSCDFYLTCHTGGRVIAQVTFFLLFHCDTTDRPWAGTGRSCLLTHRIPSHPTGRHLRYIHSPPPQSHLHLPTLWHKHQQTNKDGQNRTHRRGESGWVQISKLRTSGGCDLSVCELISLFIPKISVIWGEYAQTRYWWGAWARLCSVLF